MSYLPRSFRPCPNARRLYRRPRSSSWKSETASSPRRLAHGPKGLQAQVGATVSKKQALVPSVAAQSQSLAAVLPLKRGFGSKRAGRVKGTPSGPGRCGRLPRGASAGWKRRLGRRNTSSSRRGSLRTPTRRLCSERGARRGGSLTHRGCVGRSKKNIGSCFDLALARG